MESPHAASLAFRVHSRAPELISPAKPTPRELKVVSDIDDQGSALRFSRFPFIFFFGHNPSPMTRSGDTDPVRAVRGALAEALVYYYPFAGRLREGPNRKLMVECNGEGVVFVEADADVALEEFGDVLHPPFPSIVEELFPKYPSVSPNSPLLLMQVTRLKCGGFIFTVTFHHVMCDGAGMCQLLKAMGELARGANAPSVPPVWDRHLLSARVPASVTHAHQEYGEPIVANNFDNTPWDGRMVLRSFLFGPKEISTLRSLVPADLRARSTTFDLLASLIWRCHTFALKPIQNTETRCIVTVNARSILRLPQGYYGNVLALPMTVTTVKEMLERTLGFALRLVQEAKHRVTEEYVKSMMDHLATRGRPNAATDGALLISDARRLGYYDFDLGWGNALYGGPVEPYDGVGFFIPYLNKKGEFETVVPILLPASAMKRFAEELSRVLEGECVSCEESNKKTKCIKSLL